MNSSLPSRAQRSAISYRHARTGDLGQIRFDWPRQDSGSYSLTREQFDWLVVGLPWQRLSTPQPPAITVV